MRLYNSLVARSLILLSGLLLFTLVIAPLEQSAYGQDVIRASGGTDLSIDAVATGDFTTLSGPTIRETVAGQLQQNQTIVLSLPSGYEWNEALTGSDITLTIVPVGAQNTDLQVQFTSINATNVTFTVTTPSRSAGAGQGPGRVTIDGLQIRPANTIVPDVQQITNTGTTGPTGLSYGDLSKSVGEMAMVRVETAADGSGVVAGEQGVLAGNSLQVYAIARDAGENFIENIALDDVSDWSLIEVTGDITQTALTPSSDRRNAVFSSQLTGTAGIQAEYESVDLFSSGTITVLPRPASEMVIHTQPGAAATAGEVFNPQPVIRLLDQFGNLVTTDNSTEVTAAVESGSGPLEGTLTATASGGVATFTDLNAETANTITLRFTSSGLSAIVSNSIVVGAADSDKLVFTSVPSSGNQDISLVPPIRVQLLDAFDNVSSESDVEITLSMETGSGSFSASSSNTDAGGEAVFDDAQFTEAGIKTIRASSTGLTHAISGNIEILEDGEVSAFRIRDTDGNPLGSQTAGGSFDIQISAIDGTGTVVTTFDGTVDISSSSVIGSGGGTTAAFTDGVLASHAITLETSGNHSITAVMTGESIASTSDLFAIQPGTLELDSTVITASPSPIIADGSSTSQITVQLRDEFGNNLVSGGETITITTDQGTLSTNTESGQTSVTADDEEDGAYTATLTSSSEIGTAQVQALESGNPIASVQVDFTAGDVDAFVVTVPLDNGSPEVQTAGVSFNITVEAVDQNGNRVESYSGTLQFSTNSEISSGGTPSISNGLLENHSITLVKSGDAVTLSAEDPNLFGVSGTSQAFQVVAAAPDVTTSNVTASPSTMQNDGTSQSVITVILHDQFSNRVLTDYLSDLDISAEQIEVNGTPSSGPPDASLGNLSFNAGDANYQATLSSSSTVEKVEITVTFESVAFNQKPLVNIVVPNTWQPSGAPQQRKDWTRDANWSLGSEPGPNDFVIIPGGLADYPDLDLNITIGSLEIQENGELILFGGNSIDVAGAVLVNGSFNIEKNTSLTIGSGFTGSGTFVTGESAEIEIGGNLSIANFLARTSNTIVRLNGSSQQTISSTHMLAQRLEIQNIVVAASGNLIDLNRLIISEENTFSLQNSADITIDINSEISGGGAFTLNDNTLVMRGNIELSNIDASEGTVIFGIRLDEDFADFPGLTQQQVSNLSAMKNVVINNTHGVLTFEDVFVDGSLTLENGPLIISSGKSLIAPDQTYNNGILRFRRTINSVPGWRMISSPAGSTYSDLFDGLTLQGLSGSAFEDRQPNLFYYDETADTTDLARWRAPAATGDNIQAGRGYFFYVFGNPEDTDYNDILPKTLTVSGEENQPQNSHFAFNVSLSDAPAFDPETDDRFVELAEKGWNLIGNPFGATINWDDEANWIRENIDDVIYIWKTQDAGGGQISGDYLVWNGDTGSLGNGLITPFQAFWVKANDEAPELEIHPSAKTTGGQFRQKSRPAESYQIILSLEADSLHTTTYLNFSDVADPGLDSRDAYLLEPMSDTFLNFYSVARSRTSGQIIDLPLIINHLPHRSEQAYDIPLGVRGYREGEPVRGEYTVRLDPESSFPDHWEVRLKNNVTGETIRLRNDSNTAAKASGQSSNMSSVQEEKQNGENIDGSTGPEVSAHIDHFPGLREQRESTMKFMDRSEPVIADIGSRDIAGKVSQSAQPIESNNSNKFPFTIYVIPDDLEEGDIPQRVFLDQNYPNPFNPSTTVRYGIPRDGQVRLDVYDVLGRRVQTLADGRLEAGVHTASFDGTRLASGVYIYRLQTPQRVITRKMMLLK